MKLIAHRGNIDGPNPLEENKPEYIEEAISKGFDVEIDVRYNLFESNIYLGHDESQYLIGWYWLEKYKDNLWIHCKNIEALFEFTHSTSGFNYFWHQNDDYTLTSRNYIWTYPGKFYTPKSVIVMPETYLTTDLSSLIVYNTYGICTDYPNKLKK
jgi:hypothetical protein